MAEKHEQLYAAHHAAMRARHVEALAAENYDWLVIYAGLPHELFLDDRTCTFQANPQFKSWVPLPEHRGGAIVIGANGNTRLIYLQPRDYWDAAPADPQSYWADLFDIRVIESANDIGSQLDDLSGRVAVIADHTAPETLLNRGDVNPAQLINRLHFARAAKTDYEIANVRTANALAVRGHSAAEAAFRGGASEFEIHMAYCAACGQDQSQLPYSNIVALNEHGAVLHYTNLEHRRGTHRSFLIDAGASCRGYAADITRTYSAQTDEFQALIDSMDRLQSEICSKAVAGKDYVALHQYTHELIGGVLVDHDLVSCSASGAAEQGLTSTFFPHGLGHYIGAQVHDVGGHQASAEGEICPPPETHPFLRLTRTLTPGAICTIEPGLYFIPMLLEHLRAKDAAGDVNWQRVEQLIPYGGIRIEDNVHVSEDGNENLTRVEFARLN